MTSTPVIVTREKVAETAEIIGTTKTTGAARTSKDDESAEYPRTNLAQVLYIQYIITF